MIKEKDSIVTRGLLPLLIFALVVILIFLIMSFMEHVKKKDNTSKATVQSKENESSLSVNMHIDNIISECDASNSNAINLTVDDSAIVLKCKDGKEIVWRVEYLGVNKDTK